MDDPIQINALQRTVGVLTTAIGLAQLRKCVTEYERDKLPQPLEALIKPLGVNATELDFLFLTTSYDNWSQIIDVLYGIVKNFPWEAEVFDCDDRSALMTSLCSLIFRLNTCMGAYCQVSNATTGDLKYLHWCNIIVDKDGNLRLFDVDNGGLNQKIFGNDVIMGNCKYHFISLRAY